MEKLIAKQTMSNLTEAEAIKQAKEGDAAAFEFLYKAHYRRVYSLCLRMIKNPAEAEDLTQQAFLQLFRKIGTFRGESGFSTWLHRVTVNIVLMHIRRHKPAEFPVEDLERYSSNGEGPFEDGSSDTSMLGAIDRLNLMRAIRKLPAGYKKLFLMHDVIGYEHSEIAGLLGCSIGCSKSQVHKARKKLRRLLQGEHRRGEAGVAPAWEEADAEALPFEDASFDIVASLVGAMFAPRPDLVAQELLRVCSPGLRRLSLIRRDSSGPRSTSTTGSKMVTFNPELPRPSASRTSLRRINTWNPTNRSERW